MPFLRWLRTLGRVVVGGSPLGGFGGAALRAWGFWPFSLSARPFSLLFGRKARSIRRRFGCSSANYRRLNGVTLVALSSQSSPFRRLLRPGAFPSSYTRVGARPPSSPLRRAKVPGPRTSPLRRGKVHLATRFSTSPCESPPARPAFPLRRREVRRFAVEKSARSPGFPLRHAKVRLTARFFASPCESPLARPVFHFVTANFRSLLW